jgi:hypothetical protein
MDLLEDLGLLTSEVLKLAGFFLSKTTSKHNLGA